MVRLATTVLALALLGLPNPPAHAQSEAPVVQSQESFVYIAGEVSRPGTYPLSDPMTVVQLVALSGGLLRSADREQLILVDGRQRDKDGNPFTRFVNFRDIPFGRDLAKNNVKLGSGDVVIVRRAAQPR